MNADSNKYATRNSCRICDSSPLIDVLSLGELYVSNFLDDSDKSGGRYAAPLDLALCDAERGGCGLLQLKHTFDQEILYRNYWYLSGVNNSMREELTGIARLAERIVPLSAGDIVVDIGSNDGTLLAAYETEGITRIGFEPATNLTNGAGEKTLLTIRDFFQANLFVRRFPGKKAKIITAIAMFYDLDDPNSFLSDIARILEPNGIFIIQMSYLPSMLQQNAVDNICHEHLGYYSLSTLEWLLKRHGLEVFDVGLNDVNGGSFRIYIRHSGARAGEGRDGAASRIEDLRTREKELGLAGKGIYNQFAERVQDRRKRLTSFVESEVGAGKKIYVYGASTKGNTLLQFFKLDSSLITAAAERNPIKWGKKTVGTGIPIISEEQARQERPDYFLVLPWHFLPEFMEREKEFLNAGGKFIVPLPEFKIIGKEDLV
jgi:SAM-dependent methyltransferase